jgi:energy-coupling factor transporter transmembrane protein EcfT
MKNLDYVILLFIFVMFLPLLISLFGKIIFTLITFMLCGLIVWSFLSLLWQPGHLGFISIFFVSWIVALICAIVGVWKKRTTRDVDRLKRAIRALYSMATTIDGLRHEARTTQCGIAKQRLIGMHGGYTSPPSRERRVTPPQIATSPIAHKAHRQQRGRHACPPRQCGPCPERECGRRTERWQGDAR